MANEITIGFDESGRIQMIHDDAMVGLLDEGEVTLRRASHVEPVGKEWIADLSPSDGPVLGPFKLHQQALDAEREWLLANRL